jgi:hypothetical protein
LAAYAQTRGETGLMRWAAAYFKSPAGVEEQSFVKQFQLLEAFVAKQREEKRRSNTRN